MLKSTILLLVLFFYSFNLTAQEKNGMRLGVDLGVLAFSDSENVGLFFSLEPQLKISNNSSIGLRLAVTVNGQTYSNNRNSPFIIDERSDNGFFSAVPTFTHFWNEKRLLKRHIFRPYLGIGIGPYLLGDDIDIFPINTANPREDAIEVRLNFQIGFLLKGGIELGKSRLGLEYNFIPKIDIEMPIDQKIGTVKGRYIAISFGFTI